MRIIVWWVAFSLISIGIYAQSVDEGRYQVIIKIKMPDMNTLETLNRHFSLDRMENGYLTAYGTSDQLMILESMGLQYDLLTHPSQITPNCMSDANSLPDTTWDFYPTYTAYVNLMYQFQSLYPSLCRIEEIGTLASSRKLLAAVISKNVDSTEAEPRFLYTSSMHGDELVGYVLCLRLINHLLSNYGTDSLVTRLVNNMEIWINPLANPDGTFAVGNQTVGGATRYNASWVDINRNFPDPQDGPHPDNNPWQQETLHFMALASAKKFNMSSNIHGGAEVCNYPWDTWPQFPADNAWWQMVCNQYADTAQYYGHIGYFNDFTTGVTNGYAWYSIDGGRQDYMNYFHLCREFTLEISQPKLPPASTLPLYWNGSYRSLLRYMEQALFGLKGMVTDAISGHPVEAMVFINSHDTDSSHVRTRMPHGDYYRYLAPGSYTVTYSAIGYYPQTISGIAIAAGQSTLQNVALMPLNAGKEDLKEQLGDITYDAIAKQIKISGAGSIHALQIFDITGRLVWSAENAIGQDLPVSVMIPPGIPKGLLIIRAWTKKGADIGQPLVKKIMAF